MTCGTVRSWYLKDVKAAGSGRVRYKIAAGALPPHQIIEYVNDGDAGQAAKLQCKAMVEDMRINLNNQDKGKGRTRRRIWEILIDHQHMVSLPNLLLQYRWQTKTSWILKSSCIRKMKWILKQNLRNKLNPNTSILIQNTNSRTKPNMLKYYFLLRLAARLPWPFFGGPFPRRFNISSLDKRLQRHQVENHRDC